RRAPDRATSFSTCSWTSPSPHVAGRVDIPNDSLLRTDPTRTATEYSLADPNQRRSLLNGNLVILAHPHRKMVDAQLREPPRCLISQPGQPPEVGTGTLRAAHDGCHCHEARDPNTRHRSRRFEQRCQILLSHSSPAVVPRHVDLGK